MSAIMRAALTVACVLAALLDGGNSLSCVNCAVAGTSCTGQLVTCPATEDSCITVLTQTTSNGQVTKLITRACGKSKSDCNQFYSLSNPLTKIKISSTCCQVSSCLPATPTFPLTTSSNLNGVLCRYCSSETSRYCYTDDRTQCTGPETKCIMYGFKMATGGQITKTAMRGCTTPNFCDSGNITPSGGNTTLETTIACTDGGVLLKHSLVLPAITVLLLLKVVY